MTDTALGLSRHGFRNLKGVNFNLSAPALYEEAVRRGEGMVAKNGPLVVRTGIHTGRKVWSQISVRCCANSSRPVFSLPIPPMRTRTIARPQISCGWPCCNCPRKTCGRN